MDAIINRRDKLLTFSLALLAFLAIGSAVVLVTAPRLTSAPPRQAADTPGHDTSGTQAPTTSNTARAGAPDALGDDEFALIPAARSVPRPGEPNRLVIPSISLDTRVVKVGIVVENGKPEWETASFAAGYYRGTAQPGTRGNAVMSGHISSPVSKKGDVFRRLPDVRIGDRVEVYVDQRRITYEIAEIRVVPPTAVEVMNPTADARLTLITCYPDNIYTNRLVVTAKLLDPSAS